MHYLTTVLLRKRSNVCIETVWWSSRKVLFDMGKRWLLTTRCCNKNQVFPLDATVYHGFRCFCTWINVPKASDLFDNLIKSTIFDSMLVLLFLFKTPHSNFIEKSCTCKADKCILFIGGFLWKTPFTLITRRNSSDVFIPKFSANIGNLCPVYFVEIRMQCNTLFSLICNKTKWKIPINTVLLERFVNCIE